MPKQSAARLVPRFESDNVSSGDKGKTTSVLCLDVDGVEIVSRYDSADEYAVMQAMVLVLYPEERRAVKRIVCDSNAGLAFEVTIRTSEIEMPDAIYAGAQMEQVCVSRCGGHNGIAIRDEQGKVLFELEPFWRGDLG